VDDGSAVVECTLKHVATPKPEPELKISKNTTKKSANKLKGNAETSVNTAAARVNTIASSKNEDQKPIPPSYLPAVGTTLKVVGKIAAHWHENKKTIKIDHMSMLFYFGSLLYTR
jgi:hypothetical protein